MKIVAGGSTCVQQKNGDGEKLQTLAAWSSVVGCAGRSVDLARGQFDAESFQAKRVVQPIEEDAPPATIRRMGRDLDADARGVDVHQMHKGLNRLRLIPLRREGKACLRRGGRAGILSTCRPEIMFGVDLARRRPAPVAGALGVRRMAGRLRRLIETVAVVKPGRKTSGSLSEAAKAALGLNVPITEVLDNTLGPVAPRGTGAVSADTR
jgi:hypothetical protein